jgi:peptidyl-prolyl cis-trans isomerase SurA
MHKGMKKISGLWFSGLSTMVIVFVSLVSQAQTGTVVDEVVAVVGSKPVLLSDIENQYLQYRAQGGIRGSAKETKCHIMESSLFSKLLLNQAELDSVEVTDKQVDGELERRIRYYIQQIGSKEKLEEYFKKPLHEIKEELRGVISDQMKVEMTQQKITKDIKITPSEVRNFFNELPIDSIPLVNTEYIIGQIIRKPKVGLAEEIEVKEKLRTLRKRIMNGESFSTLAVLYSEDPGSAAKGGEVGLFGRGELYPEYEAAAFKLKPGEISDIVKSKAGYHIIQLIERRGDFINTRHILLMPKVSPFELAKASKELDSVYTLLQKGSLTFEEAVQKISDDPNKINGGLMINPQSQNNRWDPEQLDPKVLYAVDKLEPGQFSKPMIYKSEDDKDAYRILYLKERTKPHRANIKDDYDRLQNWALDKKKSEALREWVGRKLAETYIRISAEYKECVYQQEWIKYSQK